MKYGYILTYKHFNVKANIHIFSLHFKAYPYDKPHFCLSVCFNFETSGYICMKLSTISHRCG